MARPKKPEGELKDQRVPIVMSEAELKAIDDWSFKNRIRSRGEAIRRLTASGIALEEGGEELLTQVASDMHKVDDLQKARLDLMRLPTEGADISREHALKLAAACLEVCIVYDDIVWSMMEKTGDLLIESQQRSQAPLPKVSRENGLGDTLTAVRKALGMKKSQD